MKCDKYRGAVLEAAAGGNPKGRVLAHVDECSRCRATLRQDERLFVAMAETLRARMAEAPRDGFLADVRARLCQEAEPRSLMSPMWILATASVMLAMLAVIAPWKRVQREPAVVNGTIRSSTNAAPEFKVAQAKTVARRHARVQQQGKGRIAESAAREPEVLVPPDELFRVIWAE